VPGMSTVAGLVGVGGVYEVNPKVDGAAQHTDSPLDINRVAPHPGAGQAHRTVAYECEPREPFDSLGLGQRVRYRLNFPSSGSEFRVTR
jgi:hypothetical protein